MDLGLGGKRALVTGGSHGIGLSIAKGLVLEGAQVVICARDRARLSGAVSELKDCGGRVMGIRADATRPAEIRRVTRVIEKNWGGVDILVNNVGGGGRWGLADVVKTEEKVWEAVYRKNAVAAVSFTRWAIPFMKKNKWGRILTIASVFGKEGGGRPWFTMAKAAEISLMKTLAMDRELSRAGLTFNSLAPGPIMIPDTGWDRERRRNPAHFNRQIKKELVLGRLGMPEEVAAAALFLCSEKASYVNGACLAVDGGESRSF